MFSAADVIGDAGRVDDDVRASMSIALAFDVPAYASRDEFDHTWVSAWRDPGAGFGMAMRYVSAT